MPPKEVNIARDQVWAIPNAMDEKPWYKNKGLVKLNWFVSIVFLAQLNNGFDSNLISGYQAMDSWREALGYPDASRIGLLNAVSYIVGFIVAPIATYVSDRWGRRWAVIYACFTMLVGSILGCCAGVPGVNGYGMFIASRVVIGSGLAFCLMISPIILHEIVHPRWRTVIVGLFNTNYNLGAIIASWLIFGVQFMRNHWSWRIPYIVQCAPALYLIIVAWWLPESPRWLVSKGREEEALEFLVKYHGDGNPDDPLVHFEFNEMKEAIAREKEANMISWRSTLASKGNRHRLGLVVLIVSLQCLSGQATITYYYTEILRLVGITDTTKVTGINGGLNIFNYIVALTGVFGTTKIRRRPMMLLAWFGVLMSNIGIIATTSTFDRNGNNHAAIGTVAMIWTYDLFFNFVCGPLFFSYPSEVLPYTIRAKGIMVWGLVNKCWSTFNAYANPVALSAIGWRYYCVYTAVIIIQIVLIWMFLVETKGLSLEEVALCFDGEDSQAIAPTATAKGAHEETAMAPVLNRSGSSGAASDEKKI